MYNVENDKVILEHGSINRGIIAVASGKGGVGKSTVTVNLAAALSKLGYKVGIIDADVRGFSVPRILGLSDKPKAISEKEMMPPEVEGIKAISMGSFVNENSPVIWRAPLLGGALEQFFKDVHWGELDYMLLDLPPGTGDMPLNIMQKVPHAEVLVVTTPQVTATKVAGRIGKMAEKMELNLLGVIENMSYYQCRKCGNKDYIFGEEGGKNLAEFMGTELLGELPLISDLRKRSDSGRPIIFDDPEAEISQNFIKVAEKIAEREVGFDEKIEALKLNMEVE
ncbi:MAG: Mrp/NBP35 family ATP-binding protein [Halanaerobium sp.]